MNSTQRLVSLISGYEPNETSARDDGYYECYCIPHRLKYLIDVVDANSLYVLGDDVGYTVNICEARKFLDFDFTSENDKYHEFVALGA